MNKACNLSTQFDLRTFFLIRSVMDNPEGRQDNNKDQTQIQDKDSKQGYLSK